MGLFDGSSQTAMGAPTSSVMDRYMGLPAGFSNAQPLNAQTATASNGLGQVSPMGGASMIPQSPPTDPYLSTNSFSPGGGSGMMAPQLMQGPMMNAQSAASGQTASARPYVPLNFGGMQRPPMSPNGNPITQAVNMPSSIGPSPWQAKADAMRQQALAANSQGQRPPMAGMGQRPNFDPRMLAQALMARRGG